MHKAVILLSGGLDSATTLYIAREEGYRCYCLTFSYGQRHDRELAAARAIAEHAGVPIEIITIALPWGGSVLLDKNTDLPTDRADCPRSIPPTYVPARNTIFLSFAASFAEAIGADAIFIGANQIDYSGYPDCRSGYFDVWQELLRFGTKAGTEGHVPVIVAPLLYMTKENIIARGSELGVPFALTWSCYRGGQHPCGECDSCRFRAMGFARAGREDPLIAVHNPERDR
ncbi:MAG: 7-cyano-7-deazaguanine synthase QueC [Candidatus Omnitrophica bacterium]|nr:7-cyano-7-deazaguanine synthase QueC [Candidatus Omnitrophota bacterium]